jgi:RHS repeat-associated protein
MTYNADGQRTRLERSLPFGPPVIDYLWDQENVAAEHQGGSLQAAYTYRPKPYGELLFMQRGGTPSFYLFDALGSTIGLADAAKNLTDTYRYDGYGELLASTGTTINWYRWVGQYGYQFDALGQFAIELAIRARNYDPQLARWLSQDRIGFTGSPWNLYEYVSSRPTGRYNRMLCSMR